MVSQRIQRWTLMLAMYEYTIKHRPGKSNSNVDALSRLPLPDTPFNTQLLSEVILMLEQMDSLPITIAQIRTWTLRDPLLSQVFHFVQNGRSVSKLPQELHPYFTKKDELSIVDNCLLWGTRLVIPKLGRQLLLEELHEAHLGISYMKSRARMLMW